MYIYEGAAQIIDVLSLVFVFSPSTSSEVGWYPNPALFSPPTTSLVRRSWKSVCCFKFKLPIPSWSSRILTSYDTSSSCQSSKCMYACQNTPKKRVPHTITQPNPQLLLRWVPRQSCGRNSGVGGAHQFPWHPPWWSPWGFFTEPVLKFRSLCVLLPWW